MIINQQIASLNSALSAAPGPARSAAPAAPASNQQDPVAETAGSDSLAVSNHKTTILENLNASNSAALSADMSSSLLELLKSNISSGASRALQAQTAGISAQTIRLLEK